MRLRCLGAWRAPRDVELRLLVLDCQVFELVVELGKLRGFGSGFGTIVQLGIILLSQLGL